MKNNCYYLVLQALIDLIHVSAAIIHNIPSTIITKSHTMNDDNIQLTNILRKLDFSDSEDTHQHTPHQTDDLNTNIHSNTSPHPSNASPTTESSNISPQPSHLHSQQQEKNANTTAIPTHTPPITQHYINSSHISLPYIIPHLFTLYHTTSLYLISYHISLPYIIPHLFTLYYTTSPYLIFGTL